jgi:hypothetical protein
MWLVKVFAQGVHKMLKTVLMHGFNGPAWQRQTTPPDNIRNGQAFRHARFPPHR